MPRRSADALSYADFAAALDEYRASRNTTPADGNSAQWAMAAMLNQLAQGAASSASAMD